MPTSFVYTLELHTPSNGSVLARLPTKHSFCRPQPTDFASPPDQVSTPSPPKIPEQSQQSQSRAAAHTAVSPSVSWASKVTKGPPGAPVPTKQETIPEYEQQQDHMEPEPEQIVRAAFGMSALSLDDSS